MSADGRYSRHDFLTPRGIRAANYDKLREAGFSRERAAEVAAASVEKTIRKADKGMGLDADKRAREAKAPQGAPDAPRSPFRVPFPWEVTHDTSNESR